MAGEATLGKLVVRLLMDDSDFQKGAKNAQGTLGAMKGGFSGIAQTINRQVITAFKAATAAIVAFGAASTLVGAQFEQAITTVGAISGATAEEMGKLEEQARKLGASTAFSATQAADAMQDLARAGMSTDEIVATSEAALLLAGSVGAEMSDATGLMASTMAQFNLSAGESARISDVFSTAMRSTLFDMSSLTEAMKFAGTTGKGLGMTLEETTASVAMFRNLGLEGSAAGTAFRMTMAAISKVTPQAEAALAKYGLTASNVNPEMHSFAEIMTTVGEASLSTADALTIFGTRAGANVNLLAKSFADGSTKFHTVLDDLESSAGNTEDMYNSMMDTVLGQWAILRSATEELMLTVFDTFAEPLKQVLTDLGGLAAYVAEEFGASTGGIARDVQGLADQFSAWIEENKDEMVLTFKSIADIVVFVASQIPWLVANLGNVAKTIAAIYVVVQSVNIIIMMGNLVAAVSSLMPVLAAVQAGVMALMAEVVVATGGFYLLVIALGAVVSALVALGLHYTEAETAARALADAQEKAAEAGAKAAKFYNDATSEGLALAQDLQEETRNQLAAADELTSIREKELDLIRDLTEEEAALARQRGEIVEFEGQIRTVASLYEEMGEESLPTLTGEMEIHASRASEMTGEYNKLVDVWNRVLSLENSMGNVNWDSQFEEFGIASKEAAAEYMEDLDDRINAEDDAKEEIQKSLEDARQDRLQKEARAAEKLAGQKARNARKAADDEIRESKRSADAQIAEANRILEATTAIYRRSVTDLEMSLADEEERRQIAFDRELASAGMVYVDRLELASGYPQEMAEIEKEWQQVSTNMQLTFIAEEASRHLKGVQDQQQRAAEERRMAAETAKRDRFSQLDALSQMERSRALQDAGTAVDTAKRRGQRITAAERLAAATIEQINSDKEKALQDATQLTSDERAKILAEYSMQERAVWDKLTQDRKGANTDAVSSTLAGFSMMVSGARSAAQSISSAFSGAVGAMRNIADQAMSIFGGVSGFAFDMMELVQQLMDMEASAKEGGAKFDVESAAAGLVEGLLDGAMAMIEMLIAAAPVLLQTLATGLPDLIGKLATAIPILINILATEIPVVIGAIIGALPQVLDALLLGIPKLVDGIVLLLPKVVDFIVGGLPKVVAMLSQAVPVLIDGVIAEVPRLITAILSALPNVVDIVIEAVVSIISAIPSIISAILMALPSVITSLLNGIIGILTAVFNMIPLLINEVIKALPKILIALINGIVGLIVMIAQEIPVLVTSLIEMIPELIGAIIGALPQIVTTIISAIPMILMGIIAALPQLLVAIITLIPTLVMEIVKALPLIITALVVALVRDIILQLPFIVFELLKALVTGLWVAATEMIDMLVNAIRGVFSFFDGKDREKMDSNEEAGGAWDNVKGWFSGGSNYSGVEYIAATQRVTVHPGEAIVPADGGHRAGTGARSGDGGNPPGGGYIPTPSGGGGGTTRFAVMLNDRVVDEVLVSGLGSGHAPKMEARLKKVSGTVKGYSRGKFSSWS